MAKAIIDDELWALIEPLLPLAKPRRFRYPGRKPVGDRAALTGILFVLKSGIRWSDLPAEMGCGSGISCWRRLREWQRVGVWDPLHGILLAKLRAADRIDFSRVAVDAISVRAAAPRKLGRKSPVAHGPHAHGQPARAPPARRPRSC
jgi:transposase